MAESSNKMRNPEKKRGAKGPFLGITVSTVLASLIALTAIQATQIGSAAASNDHLPYPNDMNALQQVQVGDIHMAYKIFGKGEPIVLIHDLEVQWISGILLC
jgi:hypothetical protein